MSLVNLFAIATLASVLVVCGGASDKRLFELLGFKQVTITNLNLREDAESFKPFAFRIEDAEALSFGDNSFDFVVVNAGLHHCLSPHHALLEMYRVARLGLVVVEARDSGTMKIATRLRLTTEYEILPVALGGVGLRDGAYPNYVYRWTEREVRKVVASAEPHLKHDIIFHYGLSLPVRHRAEPNTAKHALIAAAHPLARLLSRLMPSQGNLFGFSIRKSSAPSDLQPWMEWDGTTARLKTQLRLAKQGAPRV
jgi:SAM-dependent methyltransferase